MSVPPQPPSMPPSGWRHPQPQPPVPPAGWPPPPVVAKRIPEDQPFIVRHSPGKRGL